MRICATVAFQQNYKLDFLYDDYNTAWCDVHIHNNSQFVFLFFLSFGLYIYRHSSQFYCGQIYDVNIVFYF